jgi:hypothetical protein
MHLLTELPTGALFPLLAACSHGFSPTSVGMSNTAPPASATISAMTTSKSSRERTPRSLCQYTASLHKYLASPGNAFDPVRVVVGRVSGSRGNAIRRCGFPARRRGLDRDLRFALGHHGVHVREELVLPTCRLPPRPLRSGRLRVVAVRLQPSITVIWQSFPGGVVNDEAKFTVVLDHFALQHRLRSGARWSRRSWRPIWICPMPNVRCCWAGGTWSRASSSSRARTVTRWCWSTSWTS